MSIDISNSKFNFEYLKQNTNTSSPITTINFVEQLPIQSCSIYEVCNNFQKQLESIIQNLYLPMGTSFGAQPQPIEPPILSKTPDVTKNDNEPKQTRPSDQVFNELMEYVFKDEGGYTNSAKDPGGATNMGICKKWYDKVMGQTTLEEFKNLTKEDAKNYYYKEYWIPSGAKKLAEQGNEKLAYAVFDAAIHHGVGTAKRLLKNSNGNAELMTDNRLAYMKGLKVWNNFSKGLQARIDKVEDRMSYMA